MFLCPTIISPNTVIVLVLASNGTDPLGSAEFQLAVSVRKR